MRDTPDHASQWSVRRPGAHGKPPTSWGRGSLVRHPEERRPRAVLEVAGGRCGQRGQHQGRRKARNEGHQEAASGLTWAGGRP